MLTALVLGFSFAMGTNNTRDGPDAKFATVLAAGDVVSTTAALPSAAIDTMTLIDGEMINLVSTAPITGVEDGLVTGLAIAAALPLLFYIALTLSAIVGVMAFVFSYFGVDTGMRRIGGAAARHSLRSSFRLLTV